MISMESGSTTNGWTFHRYCIFRIFCSFRSTTSLNDIRFEFYMSPKELLHIKIFVQRMLHHRTLFWNFAAMTSVTKAHFRFSAMKFDGRLCLPACLKMPRVCWSDLIDFYPLSVDTMQCHHHWTESCHSTTTVFEVGSSHYAQYTLSKILSEAFKREVRVLKLLPHGVEVPVIPELSLNTRWEPVFFPSET